MPSANLSCREALACKFGGPKSFGLQFRGPKWIGSEIRLVALRLRPSLRAARRASFPLCCGGPTTLFDAEERLLKRSVRLLDALELIWTTNGCLRPRVRTVPARLRGKAKVSGKSRRFLAPLRGAWGNPTLWMAATYMWLRRSDLGCLRERTGKEGETRRICDRKIDFVLGCSRRELDLLASKPGKPIKRYASAKFLPTHEGPVRVSSDLCDRFLESSSFGRIGLGLVPR